MERKEERAGKGVTHGKEVGLGWREKREKREILLEVSLWQKHWLSASLGRSGHPTSFELLGTALTKLTLLSLKCERSNLTA